MSSGGARIPSLDGLRAVSIIAVLLGHLAGTSGFPDAVAHVVHSPRVDISALGVRVFFVISGFLITGLLRNEEARRGTVSLKQFYLRRTFRIMPAYFAFLGMIAVLAAMGLIAVPQSDFWHALTYTVNYAPNRTWYVAHLWSLSVEEQFYLLWPAVVAFRGSRQALHVALAVLVAVPFIRLAEAAYSPSTAALSMGTTFETAADALAIGCVLALVRDTLIERAWYRRLLASSWMIPALFVIGMVLTTRLRPGLLVGTPLTNVAIALWIDRCVRAPDGLVGRVLNTRPLMFVGTLSYSIYLWQQLFLNRGSSSLVAAFPVNLLCAAAAALMSFYLVEQPFLRLRTRGKRALDAERALP